MADATHYYAETDRQQPLMTTTTKPRITTTTTIPPNSRVTTTTSLNDRLNTNYIDIPAEDVSFCANLTRYIVSCVGHLSTPRQLLAGLRIVKAVTFCFLVLTIASDITYVCFVEMLASSAVRAKVGGSRDTIIRLYGLAMVILAIMIELDASYTTKYFSGLKGFLPRSLLLFFIATITGGNPLHDKSSYKSNSGSSSSNYSYNNYNSYSSYIDTQVTNEIPSSAVVFQMVTSFVLYVAKHVVMDMQTYFVMEILLMVALSCCSLLLLSLWKQGSLFDHVFLFWNFMFGSIHCQSICLQQRSGNNNSNPTNSNTNGRR
jgi:hypothetical protein